MKIKHTFNSKIAKFFSSKTLLNIVVAISFLNIIWFVIFGETIAIIYFILIGLVTSFFSKNMVIVLSIPLVLVNLFLANTIFSNSVKKREGLENKTDNNDSSSSTSKNDKNKKKTSTSSSTNQGLPITPLDNNTTETNTPENDNNIENNIENKTEIDESFEVGRSKKNSKGYNIDYASTVEDAYDELNKILGSDGIKRLTSDTQNLMKQQMQLAESMKSMQPLIAGMAPIMKQAEGLLGSMGQTGNLGGNLADIAKKFSSGIGSK
jgi:hypothetical protein